MRKRVFILSVFIVLIPVLFLVLIRVGLFGEFPRTEELKKLNSYNAARILASDGDLAGLYFLQKRSNISLASLPDYVINALIATEDARFYKHHGFDMRASLRVLFKSLIMMKSGSGGGSTLSQQLAKNLFPRKNYGILTIPVAKVREIIIARQLEKVYSKQEILELYLNTVSFSDNTFGIGAASYAFFSKSAETLQVEESALLVGTLKANYTYNPRLFPEEATERRNVVLAQMAKYGYLEKKECDSLQKLPLNLKLTQLDHDSGPAPYFREQLRQELVKILRTVADSTGLEYNLYTDGLTIYTTLDLDLQRAAEEAVHDHLKDLQGEFKKSWAGKEPWRKDLSLLNIQVTQSQPYQTLIREGLSHEQALESMKEAHPSQVFTWQGIRDTLISPLDSILCHFELLQCGLVALDPATGAILAWIGGDNYEFFKYDHVMAKRQTGSTFKPFVYAAAIENGMNPCRLYSAETESYEEYEGWTPRNYDNKDDGYYSFQGALVHSVNTISVKIMMETGIDNVRELAAKLGISSYLPEVPSLALGTADISLFEMAGAYAVIENKGYAVHPYSIEKITDRNNKVIYKNPHHAVSQKVLSAATSEIMIGMLKAVADRGTAASLRTGWHFKNELAGKTGTTQDQSDGWFIGMTPSIVIGIWVGGESPAVRFKSGSQGNGAYAALPVFAGIVQQMNEKDNLRHYVQGSFNLSDSVTDVLNCIDFSERRGLRINARQVKNDPARHPARGKKSRR